MKQKPYRMKFIHLGLTIALSFIVLAMLSCNKSTDAPVPDTIDKSSNGLAAETIAQLKTARNATLKYRSMDAALADGYVDINVVQENMGFHLMKASLVDTIFDPAKPELLVYNRQHDSSIELVAVEYAVPIPLSPNKAPEGFHGSSDSWSYSTKFNLWLLHSWVWSFNPQGIFNPTNPLVHSH